MEKAGISRMKPWSNFGLGYDKCRLNLTYNTVGFTVSSFSNDSIMDCHAFSDHPENPTQSDGDLSELTHSTGVDLYARFFNYFTNPHKTSTIDIHDRFQAIARIETGELFYRTATFVSNSNETIQVHVDWRYLYRERKQLETNWRTGFCKPTVLDAGADIANPAQRVLYCVHSDRDYLAAGSREGQIKLWSMQDFRYLGILGSCNGSVLCLQLDSTVGILVSGGATDSSVMVWDFHNRRPWQTLRGHTARMLGVHVDGRYIVSCSVDTTARVWYICEDETKSIPADSDDPMAGYVRHGSLPRYVLLHTLRGHRGAVNSVHFKGNTIATASADKTV